jgi:hypothetical protein
MIVDNSHVFLALLHYPVYDKNGRIVATSITNYDIHDISRLTKTYNLGGFYMVTPLVSQQELCRRIIRHWVDGFGSTYNQTRFEAFSTTHLADSLQEVIELLREQFQAPPVVIITSAREHIADECGKSLLRFHEARNTVRENRTNPYLIVLGTGYGIENQCICEYGHMVLEPVQGVAGYNHLSVRSAAAIMIDRVFGRN